MPFNIAFRSGAQVSALYILFMDESNDEGSLLEESMNTFTMQLNSALKEFDILSGEFIQLLLFAL